MKLTAILLLATCLQVYAKGTAQITLSEKKAPLEKVLKAIKQQSGYALIYDVALVQKQGKPVDIIVNNVPVDKALAIAFQNQTLSFEITNKNIILVKEKETPKTTDLIITPPLPVLIDVHGIVKDEIGKAVVGASVLVKGTNKGTTTNNDGEFVLTGVDDKATLVISAINIETRENGVNGRKEINFVAKTKVSRLEDVEIISVNTGYQLIPKERATGSFTNINESLLNRRISTDILSRLEGITSGMVFNRDRSGNTTLNIRGRSSIFASIDPLIVLDNFPYDGDINGINPNDIESITILKDAAAASIWGVRAGNGVIVITTKKGKENQPLKVTFNTNITIGDKPDIFYKSRFLNSNDFIAVEDTLFRRGFYTNDFTATDFRPISPVIEILKLKQAGLISSADADGQINSLRQNDIRNDLLKYFYRKSVFSQNALSLSGGSAKNSYYLSGGIDNNLQNVVGNNYQRVTLNLQNHFFLSPKFEFSTGIQYIQSNTTSDNTLTQMNTGGSRGYEMYPYAKLADDNGNALPILKDYRTSFVQNAPSQKLLDWTFAPVNELGLTDNKTKTNDIRVSTGLKYSFNKAFSAEVKYQYQTASTQNRILYNQNSYVARSLINKYSVITSGAVSSRNIPIGDILSLASNNLVSQAFRGQLNYSKIWDKHNLTALGGIEVREVRGANNSSRLYGYDDAVGTFQPVNLATIFTLYPTGSSSIPNNIATDGTLDRFRSFFTNISYGYDQRYIFSTSARMDQSNLFGVNTNQRSVPLWSTGFLWNIFNENFYNSKALPILKLRVTYGLNGNLNKTISAYTVARYSSATFLTRAPYASITFPGNADLQWEKSAMLNIGLDFEMHNKNLWGSIEFFHKKGTDLIGDAAVASSTGFTVARGNYSGMTGKGVDVVINSKHSIGKIQWVSNFMFSYATDKVSYYTGKTLSPVLVVGNPVSSIYSYRWAGLDPKNGDPMGYLADTVSKVYGSIISSTGADPLLLKYEGPANPVFYGGFRNSFTWKNLSLSINLTYKGGYYFFRNSILYARLFNTWQGNNDYSKRWQQIGDESITQIPSMPSSVDQNRDAFYSQSSVLVQKGDHIRLQDISFSYNINNSGKRSIPFKDLQLYLYLNNLGILWRANQYKIDPDFIEGYPSPMTCSIGVKTTF